MKLRSLYSVVLSVPLFCCFAHAMQQQTTSSNSQILEPKGLQQVPFFESANKREIIGKNGVRVIIQRVPVLQQQGTTCGYHAFKNACLLTGLIHGRTDGALLNDPTICDFFGDRSHQGLMRQEIIKRRKSRACRDRIVAQLLKTHPDPSQVDTAYRATLESFIENRINVYDNDNNQNTIDQNQIRQALAQATDRTQNDDFNNRIRQPSVYEGYVTIRSEPIMISYETEQLNTVLCDGENVNSNEIKFICDNCRAQSWGRQLTAALGDTSLEILDWHSGCDDFIDATMKNLRAAILTGAVSADPCHFHAFLIGDADQSKTDSIGHWIAMILEIVDDTRRYTIADSLNGDQLQAGPALNVIQYLENKNLSETVLPNEISQSSQQIDVTVAAIPRVVSDLEKLRNFDPQNPETGELLGRAVLSILTTIHNGEILEWVKITEEQQHANYYFSLPAWQRTDAKPDNGAPKTSATSGSPAVPFSHNEQEYIDIRRITSACHNICIEIVKNLRADHGAIASLHDDLIGGNKNLYNTINQAFELIDRHIKTCNKRLQEIVQLVNNAINICDGHSNVKPDATTRNRMIGARDRIASVAPIIEKKWCDWRNALQHIDSLMKKAKLENYVLPGSKNENIQIPPSKDSAISTILPQDLYFLEIINELKEYYSQLNEQIFSQGILLLFFVANNHQYAVDYNICETIHALTTNCNREIDEFKTKLAISNGAKCDYYQDTYNSLAERAKELHGIKKLLEQLCEAYKSDVPRGPGFYSCGDFKKQIEDSLLVSCCKIEQSIASELQRAKVDDPKKKSVAANSYADLFAAAALQTPFEEKVTKILSVSPVQSMKLFALTLKLESILDKFLELRMLIAINPNPKEAELNKVITELLKIEKIKTQEQIVFVKALIAKDVHHVHHEIKIMLDNLVFILEHLDALYSQLAMYQQSKKSVGLIQALKNLDAPYETFKGKLLVAIELSSLRLENPFDLIKQQELKEALFLASNAPVDLLKQGASCSHEQSIAKMTAELKATTELRKLILNDDRKGILKLIQKKNIDINKLEEDGVAALHIACLWHKADAISALLDSRANTNLYSAQGFTPLHYVLFNKCPDQQKQLNIINTLLQERYRTNLNAAVCANYWLNSWRTISIFNGWTALHFAARLGCENFVQSLINHQARVNILSSDEETALHIAFTAGFASIVKLLGADGADVMVGSSPINIAIANGHSDMVDTLVARSPSQSRDMAGTISLIACIGDIPTYAAPQLYEVYSDYKHGKISFLEEIFGFHGVVPSAVFGAFRRFDGLGYGAEGAYHIGILANIAKLYKDTLNVDQAKMALEITRALLDREDAESQKDMANSLMPHAVLSNLNVSLIDLLLKYGADVQEAFNSAMRGTNNEECLRFLMSKGAKVDKSDPKVAWHYCTEHLIHEATDAEDIPRLKALLESPGASANEEDLLHNHTPAHIAAAKGYLDALQTLTERLASIKVANDFGLLPLHIAVFNGHTPIVSYLLRNKEDKVATLNRPNIHGLRPLHAAIMAEKVDAARLLLDHGADATIQNERGLTPLHYASQLMRMQFDINFAIPRLIQQHGEASPLEDHGFTVITQATNLADTTGTTASKNEETVKQRVAALDIGELFNGLKVKGLILPSLQQVRPAGQITGYCGYYALYNALALLNPRMYESLDRLSFAKFFELALKTMATLRKYDPCDNLMANEIRHLVNTLYPNEPIIALDKNALYALISGKISLEAAFDNDQKSVNLWRQFVKGDRNELVIVAGIGIDVGHWITIQAKREDGDVSIRVTDSLCQIRSWLSNDRIFSHVLPFYLAITTPEQYWQGFFDDALNHKLFAEYQEENDKNVKRKANVICAMLDQFIESIDDMNESLQDIILLLRMNQDQPANDVQKYKQSLLSYMRFYNFNKMLAEMQPELLISKSKLLPAKNPATIALDDLLKLLFDQSAQALEGINGLLAQKNNDSICRAINVIITFLKNVREQAQIIVETINNDDLLLTAESVFDADLLPLDQEHAKSIIDRAPAQIKNIIGHLKNPNVEQQKIRILFVGPPGNGKTTLAQAIAQECQRPYRFIRASALGDSYQFSRERDLKRLLPFIQQHPDAVIIIDEIDAIKDRENEPNRTAEVLQSIIDICNRRFPRVIFIATTNDQKAIPLPLFSRLSQTITEISKPDYESRLHIINRCVRLLPESKVLSELSPQYIKTLANKTDHFSVRHIEAMFSTAIIRASSRHENVNAQPKMNTITPQIMDYAWKSTCESLKDERISMVRKVGRYIWSNKETIGHFCYMAAETGLQGYNLYTHAKERQEELRRRDTESSCNIIEKACGAAGTIAGLFAGVYSAAKGGALAGASVGGPVGAAAGAAIGFGIAAILKYWGHI